jgi:DNA-directed RNA polymerase specialized sigma24 family protein
MEAALGEAISFGALGEEPAAIADGRAEVETLVMLRHDLRRVERLAGELTADQRLVLAAQVGLQSSCADFCRHFGWSPDKYRKVAQRARTRLRELMAQEE